VDDKEERKRERDGKFPHRVALRRQGFAHTDRVMGFLMRHFAHFDLYVEQEDAPFVHYCFASSADAQKFRDRFAPKNSVSKTVH
jgi:hypothetical protein